MKAKSPPWSVLAWRNRMHDYFPSDISEWRVSCSNTTTSNLQQSIESAAAGLALKLRTTRDGWKRTAILPALSFADCQGFSALLSSHRRGAAKMLLLPLLSSRTLFPNGWFSTDRKQRHRPRC